MAPKRANLAVAFVLCFAMVWRMAAWKGKGTGPALYASGAHSSSSLLAVNETNATRELADVVHRVASAVSAASMIQGTAKLADESQDGAVETGKAIAFNELVFKAITEGAQKFENKKDWEEKFINKLFEVQVPDSGGEPKPKRPLVDEVHFLAAFSRRMTSETSKTDSFEEVHFRGTFGSYDTIPETDVKFIFEKLWKQGRSLVVKPKATEFPEGTRVLHYDCTKSFWSESYCWREGGVTDGVEKCPVTVGVWEEFLKRNFPSDNAWCLDAKEKVLLKRPSDRERIEYDGITVDASYESNLTYQDRANQPKTQTAGHGQTGQTGLKGLGIG